MGHNNYSLIAQNAINSGEIEWAEKFIYYYKKEVHADFRENIFNFVLSILELKKKNYDSALSLLSKVQTFDIPAKLNINQILLMIYFCKNETESFISLVDSYRHFLKRNKNIRAIDRIHYNNFINYINKLHNWKIKSDIKDKSEIILIRNKLEPDTNVISKKWLIDQINEMLKK